MSGQTHARQLVVFTLAGEQHALAIKQVHKIIRYTQPRPVASTQDWVRGVLSLRGRIVPVYDLAARLETTRIYTRPSAEDRTRALDLLPVDK
jgi:purine-binding chemotaxis protein CheW